MFIKYTNYSDDVHYFKLSKEAKKLGLKDPFTGNVNLACKMDKSNSQIIITCDLSVDTNLICDRCGDKFNKILSTEFMVTYLFSKASVSENSLDVFYLSPDKNIIDLSDIVKEYCILILPMKVLCKEDCKGLCPHCGTNLNYSQCSCEEDKINPVWEPLLKLKNKIN